jgi:hypothetical protein
VAQDRCSGSGVFLWSQSEPVASWEGLPDSARVLPLTAPGPAARVRDTTTDLEVGVLLPMAV